MLPSKLKVAEYIEALFKEIDADGSGQIEYNELKGYTDNSLQVQDFLLAYTGFQTFARAKMVYI